MRSDEAGPAYVVGPWRMLPLCLDTHLFPASDGKADPAMPSLSRASGFRPWCLADLPAQPSRRGLKLLTVPRLCRPKHPASLPANA